jgi:hypothetical protein
VSVAVLVLVHARPRHTRAVLEAIKDWDISCLYIAADGPRADHPEEFDTCARTRSIALAHAGDRPVKTLFRDENLGLAQAVSSALDWFFEHESEGIILEDDCVPDASFLPFCEELLSRYRDTPRVMMISGNNYLDTSPQSEREYLFSRHVHIWGWATWKRAWQLNDLHMTHWKQLRTTDWLLDVCNGHKDARRYWRWIFDRSFRSNWRSWAYPWTLSMWRHEGLAVLPGRNLVTNIGFGDFATNTFDRPDWYEKVSTAPINFPLIHPESIAVDPEIDYRIDRHIFILGHC